MKDKLLKIQKHIGNTPTVKLEHGKINLFAKLEYYNYSKSIKARSAFLVIKTAIEQGRISQDTTVIESSSGNMAIALAEICAYLEINFIAVIDPHISKYNERRLKSLPCKVVKVTEADHAGGYLISRLNKVKTLCRATNTYWTNQYENKCNYLSHYLGTGLEICNKFSSLDFAFIGVSSGGTITGVSKRLKEKFPNIRIVAVDAEGSVIFGQKPKRRALPGLGSSIRPPLIDKAEIDEVVHISDAELIQGCHKLHRRHGVFAGGSSGAVFAAIEKYFSNYKTAETPKVIFLCADGGEPYKDLIYDQDTAKDTRDKPITSNKLHEEEITW